MMMMEKLIVTTDGDKGEGDNSMMGMMVTVTVMVAVMVAVGSYDDDGKNDCGSRRRQ